jgi:hypothetical protein
MADQEICSSLVPDKYIKGADGGLLSMGFNLALGWKNSELKWVISQYF